MSRTNFKELLEAGVHFVNCIPTLISTDDAIETEPALHGSIFAILIRFRRWKIALCSDGKSAFHALKLNVNDQYVCRK